MKQKYIDNRFQKHNVILIAEIEKICSDLYADGYTLTVRQIYYQLVTKNLIERDQKQYKRVAQLCNDARLAGLLDWDYIVDRTRNVKGMNHWDSPTDIIDSAYQSYRIDKWARQENYIEVWVEKDALVGVIERVSNELDLNFFACRGFVSQSEMREAATRFNYQSYNGKNCTLIHLGDHDPSGIYMTKDIRERLDMFGAVVDVNRVALTIEQVSEFNLPANPANEVDARFAEYELEFGNESWEVDALSPRTMHEIITDAVIALRDDTLWNEDVERERTERATMQVISENWQDLEAYIETTYEQEILEILGLAEPEEEDE